MPIDSSIEGEQLVLNGVLIEDGGIGLEVWILSKKVTATYISIWSDLWLSQEPKVLWQCVAACVKIWWLNGQVPPRFVEWERSCFLLFIHNMKAWIIYRSAVFFSLSFWSAENNYCLWQVKGLRFYPPPSLSFGTSPLYWQLPASVRSSPSLLRKHLVASLAGSAGCHALTVD